MAHAPESAQEVSTLARPIVGTRVDISASGSVTRVPDLAIISAGVVTKSASASGAIADNAARMERVRAALKRAGIADRDVQTSNISLNPEYRYQDNQPPQLTGYTASNQVNVREGPGKTFPVVGGLTKGRTGACRAGGEPHRRLVKGAAGR